VVVGTVVKEKVSIPDPSRAALPAPFPVPSVTRRSLMTVPIRWKQGAARFVFRQQGGCHPRSDRNKSDWKSGRASSAASTALGRMAGPFAAPRGRTRRRCAGLLLTEGAENAKRARSSGCKKKSALGPSSVRFGDPARHSDRGRGGRAAPEGLHSFTLEFTPL